MTTIQFTTTESVNPCRMCTKSPKVSHVENCGLSTFSVGCCGESKTHQFFSVALDSWNFDMEVSEFRRVT